MVATAAKEVREEGARKSPLPRRLDHLLVACALSIAAGAVVITRPDIVPVVRAHAQVEVILQAEQSTLRQHAAFRNEGGLQELTQYCETVARRIDTLDELTRSLRAPDGNLLQSESAPRTRREVQVHLENAQKALGEYRADIFFISGRLGDSTDRELLTPLWERLWRPALPRELSESLVAAKNLALTAPSKDILVSVVQGLSTLQIEPFIAVASRKLRELPITTIVLEERPPGAIQALTESVRLLEKHAASPQTRNDYRTIHSHLTSDREMPPRRTVEMIEADLSAIISASIGGDALQVEKLPIRAPLSLLLLLFPLVICVLNHFFVRSLLSFDGTLGTDADETFLLEEPVPDISVSVWPFLLADRLLRSLSFGFPAVSCLFALLAFLTISKVSEPINLQMPFLVLSLASVLITAYQSSIAWSAYRTIMTRRVLVGPVVVP